jgi:ABC-type branched-subunit amino acid transport system ATPase component
MDGYQKEARMKQSLFLKTSPSGARPADDGDVALTATGINLAFGGVVVLNQVDLRVLPGQVLGLIGPNGAGKTTFINVLTGFQRPDSGRVSINGRDVTSRAMHQRVKDGLGRTFQGARVFPEMTTHENVEVAALRGGFSRKAARREATEILERCGLLHLQHFLAGTLSFGDERRLGLARALALRPSYLLLDEPAAGLDEHESIALSQTIAEIREQEGCGILIIEHDMRLIMSLCDQIQVLDYGRTIARGTPEEIRNNAAVISAYLGSSL